MAEMAVWMRPESDVDNLRSKIAAIVTDLRSVRDVFATAALETGNGENGGEEGAGGERVGDARKIFEALGKLLALIEEDGNDGEVAAVEFGRRSGHVLLMSLLDSSPDDTIRDLAAQAVEVCTEKCPRFPMKGSVIDPEDINPLRCKVEITSELDATGHPITLHLIRRAHSPSDTDLNPCRSISNMLWAGSMVLVRVFQSKPSLLSDIPPRPHPPSFLELGAGIGGGGLGVALMAKALGLSGRLCITDVDPEAVDVIRAALRANSLVTRKGGAREGEGGGDKDGEGAGGLECSGMVLDWDKLETFWGEGSNGEWFRKCDVIFGAEIIHEIPHAAGVFGAVTSMMAPGGVTVIVNGSSKQRYGVVEFQAMLAADERIAWSVEDVDPRLTEDMESLREKMLQLQLYFIRWK